MPTKFQISAFLSSTWLSFTMPHVFPELLHVVCEFFPVYHLQSIFFHLADRISLLKFKFDHVIHLLNIFNTSFLINVNRITCPVSLGWLSSDLFLHFKNPLLFPHTTHVFYSCPINCFRAFILWRTVSSSWNVMAHFLTHPSKLSSSMLSQNLLFIYTMRFTSIYYKCLFTCISSDNMFSKGKSLA